MQQGVTSPVMILQGAPYVGKTSAVCKLVRSLGTGLNVKNAGAPECPAVVCVDAAGMSTVDLLDYLRREVLLMWLGVASLHLPVLQPRAKSSTTLIDSNALAGSTPEQLNYITGQDRGKDAVAGLGDVLVQVCCVQP